VPFVLTSSRFDSCLAIAYENSNALDVVSTTNILDSDGVQTNSSEVADWKWHVRAPMIVAASANRQYVAFYAHKSDSMSVYAMNGVYLAYTSDGGLSWSVEHVDSCYVPLATFASDVGPSIGVTLFDSMSVGIAYKRDADSLYFARVEFDTV
jgi:hypothetical protein